jgi:hypothetical protein
MIGGVLITWRRSSKYRVVQLGPAVRVATSWAVLVLLSAGIVAMAVLLNVAPSPAVVDTCSPGMVAAAVALLSFPYRLRR